MASSPIKSEDEMQPNNHQSSSSSGPSATINAPAPPEMPDEVDTSFLVGLFGSEKNIRSSSLNHSTMHKSTLSRSAVKYSKQASEDDLEARRKVVVTPLSNDRAQAMGAGQRFLNNLRASKWAMGEEGAEDSSERGIRMYRLQSAATSTNDGCCQSFSSFLCSIINCGASSDSPTSMNERQNPNIWITNIFYWLFRRGWRTVFMISLLNFYILVLIFTLLIVIWTTYVDNDCVVVGGEIIGTLPKRSVWMDAFSLSWNTISTVGYGSTYPSLSTEHNHQNDADCIFISFLTSFEAFVGVLYAGFTGGIIYAKVTRLTQRARVKFSDPLLIKYGTGVDASTRAPMGLDNPTADDGNNGDVEQARTKDTVNNVSSQSPFPVLEFRLANELHNVAAAEIISSQINAVVVIEASKQDGEEISDELAKQIKMERLKRTSKTRRKSVTPPFGSFTELSTHSSSTSIEENTSCTRSTSSPTSSVLDKTKLYFGGNKKMKIDEEEEGSVIVPKLIFCKLDLDHSEHPFFKRLWTFRHVINGDSPLLTSAAKQRIMENGGVWPREWNDSTSIRNAIRFNQIIVSFTGVSNINAANVYKQKVYDYVDLIVGYRFVNPMYRSSSGKLKVDLKLMNDVIEQNGGGGENLNVVTR